MTIVTFTSQSSRQKLSGLLGDGNTVANYQPGVGVTGSLTATAWANQIGAAGSLDGTGHAPIYLPFIGAKYAYLPAVASNTFTTPTKTVTGSFTITFDLALNDYTPAADVTLLDKSSAVDGFIVKWLTTDKVRLVIGDGVAATNVDMAAATTLTDGTRHTIAIAWSDGVGATFSIDGTASAQVAAAKTLTNVATNLTLGSATSIGKIYSLSITSLYGFNASDWAETSANAATQVSSTTGETWTLNNTGALPAQIVGSPSLLFDGTAMYIGADFALIQPATYYIVLRQITWTLNDLFTDGKDATHRMGTFGQSASSPNVIAYAGSSSTENTNLALGAYGLATIVFNGASSSLKIDSTTATTGDFGAQDAGGLYIGTFYNGGTPAGFGNIQFKEIIVRTVADGAATQAQIQALLKAIHGTP